MEFMELVKTRQSVRAYTDDSVEDKTILKCLEAARLAPSATNSQPWRFIIVDEPELREKIAQSTFSPIVKFNKFTLHAPTLVVVAANKGNGSSKFGQMMTGLPYYLIDVGIAAEHFCLQAAEEGLGTCILGWFNEKKIKKHLSFANNERVALVIAVGYPKNQEIRDKKRKNLDTIYQKNK